MKPFDRFPRPTLTLLGASLALNMAFLAYHARIGTFRRVFVKLDLLPASTAKSAYQAEMENRYRKLPSHRGEILFAGDSLIHQGPWAEFFPGVANRGIPEETSAFLLGRVGDLLRNRPRQLIFLIGANDFNQGVPAAQLLRNDRAILAKVRADSPETAIVVVGMLPVRPGLPGGPRYDNRSVVEANRQVEALVREFPGTRFLDLTAKLADESGNLRPEFTLDGLHLTIDGYLAIRDAVRGVLVEPEGSDHPGSGGKP